MLVEFLERWFVASENLRGVEASGLKALPPRPANTLTPPHRAMKQS
jgi:hypothetical protein